MLVLTLNSSGTFGNKNYTSGEVLLACRGEATGFWCRPADEALGNGELPVAHEHSAFFVPIGNVTVAGNARTVNELQQMVD